MSAATTLEAASASTMNRSAAMEPAPAAIGVRATVEAGCRSMSRITVARVAVATASVTVAGATVTITAASVAPAASIVTMAPAAAAPVIPRAGANEDSADKPARPVISVRSARVRIVAVVAIGTNRSRSNIAWADAHAYADLSLRVGQWNHQNRQQRHIL